MQGVHQVMATDEPVTCGQEPWHIGTCELGGYCRPDTVTGFIPEFPLTLKGVVVTMPEHRP